MPRPDRISLGKLGEDLACHELQRRGYEILARRYRTRLGEIDIVARDGATVVFVEVKARTSRRFGHPAEAVTWRKRDRLALMAADFLLRRGWAERPCRFDVVAVDLAPGRRAGVEVFTGAFEAVSRA